MSNDIHPSLQRKIAAQQSAVLSMDDATSPTKAYGPVTSTILRALKEAGGEWLTKEQLLDAVYNGSGAHAPEDEENVFRVLLCKLRKNVRIERASCYRIISD